MADNSPYCWLVPFIFRYSNYTAAVANGVNSKQQAVGGTPQVRTRLRYSKNEKHRANKTKEPQRKIIILNEN